jgi:hypothetical protein
MARTHCTFRLSKESLDVIQWYLDKNKLDDRTAALEGILSEYANFVNRPRERLKRLFSRTCPDPAIKPLEAFTHE